MKCSLPPHQPLTFSSFDEYDVHYQKTHVNRCQECRKNFPDDHFLHLHITENHDPISAMKRERGEKIYQCLLPTCSRPCSTPKKRRLHMIDKHQFPRDYDFFIVNNGIDRRTSMLRAQHRRKSSTMSANGNGAGTRKRGESSASVMSVVEDKKKGDEMEDDDHGEDLEDEESSEQESETEPVKPGQKAPIKPVTPTRKAPPQARESSEEEMSSEEEDEESGDSASAPTKSSYPVHSPKSPKVTKHTPLKLRGRGGFGRVGQRNTPVSPSAATAISTSIVPTKPASKATDVDGLTSSMSALQFIPNSVRKARERAKSNATGAE
ncbi:hypothetical protein K504DRAFT_457581 [Pleomassaria siparia CBS 279.74]|uniref:C2H2-type domain-containing protein n=1 Tax=Pleomassaria siparia CBS 279.74 TaxID=1314801 RepID=A0A6G1KRH5_9PLEO|nr:hypothetical protein K504DRAFT_457581 [Pleomassaria siparia CBS 279.74]